MFIFVAKITKYIDTVHFHRQKCLEKRLWYAVRPQDVHRLGYTSVELIKKGRIPFGMRPLF